MVSAAEGRQLPFQMLVTKAFFLLGEMDLPQLLRAVLVVERFLPELLTGQVEPAAAHCVEAVIVSAGPENAVDLPAENILDQEGGDGALTQGPVFRGPVMAQPGGAGLGAPDLRKGVVQIQRGTDAGILVIHSRDIGLFPAPELICHVAVLLPVRGISYAHYSMKRKNRKGKVSSLLFPEKCAIL